MECPQSENGPSCPVCGREPLGNRRPHPAEIVGCAQCGSLLKVCSLRPLRFGEAEMGDFYWGE